MLQNNWFLSFLHYSLVHILILMSSLSTCSLITHYTQTQVHTHTHTHTTPCTCRLLYHHHHFIVAQCTIVMRLLHLVILCVTVTMYNIMYTPPILLHTIIICPTHYALYVLHTLINYDTSMHLFVLCVVQCVASIYL